MANFVRVGLNALDERAEMVTAVAARLGPHPLAGLPSERLEGLRRDARLSACDRVLAWATEDDARCDPSYPAWNARRRVLPWAASAVFRRHLCRSSFNHRHFRAVDAGSAARAGLHFGLSRRVEPGRKLHGPGKHGCSGFVVAHQSRPAGTERISIWSQRP
jgi:hypothetical protein